MSDVNIENLYIRIDGDGIATEKPEFVQSYEDIVELFDDAINSEQVVRFMYTTEGSGGVEQMRTLTPSEIQPARDEEVAVLGHDHDRGHARQFRLDRVTMASFAPEVPPYRG